MAQLAKTAGCAIAVWACAQAALAEDFELKALRTPDLTVLYTPEQAYLAPYAARTFVNSLRWQQRIFAWEPDGRIWIVLTDLSDYNNGGATATPVNGVTVMIAPDSHTLETTPGNERMYMLANHELVHVAMMDMSNSQDRFWRRLVGGKPRQVDAHPESILFNYLTVPRLNAPRWYHEGAASFMETWMSGGFGRAQGAYDEMVFRAMVRDGTPFHSPLSLVAQGVASDFQTMSNAYLYGTRFISYLALRESPQKVVRWLRRDEDSKRYYSDQFEHVFGKPLEQAWDEWIAWEQDFQRGNLAQVRAHPLTPLKRLVPEGLGSVSKSYVDPRTNSLVGALYYPGVLPHVAMVPLDGGPVKRLADIKGPMKYRVTSTAFDPQARTLFYTEDNLELRDLFAIDLATGDKRLLLQDARIGDLAFNPADKSLWGLRHDNGYVTLVRIPHPYTDYNQLHTFPYGTVPFDLDFSPDGQTLAMSVGEIDGAQSLRLYRTAQLAKGEVAPVKQADFGQAVPEGFAWTPDGQFLYGSAYYTGISNIYRFEPATGGLEAVSNSETGLFRPIPQPDGSIVALEHTGAGFTPVQFQPRVLPDLGTIRLLGAEIAKAHPIVMQQWGAGSPTQVPLEQMTLPEKAYVPVKEMRFSSAYPIVQGYRDTAAAGYHFDFADPLGIESLGLTATYTPGQDLLPRARTHLEADYKNLNWRLRYWHNRASFYDLFGPTKRSLQGDAVIVGYRQPLLLDDPRRLDFTADAARYTGLATTPGNQNVQATSSTLNSLRAGWRYTETYRSANAIDHERGHRWNVNLSADDDGRATALGARAGFDVGVPIGPSHMSIWAYNAAGRVTGPRSNSNANWYFGGFHNNRVDDGEVKRYREYDTFPGYRIDDIEGQGFVRSLVELNLPPLRVASFGTPAFYVAGVRPALFAGVLVTDPGRAQRRNVHTVGAQLDLQLQVLHRMPMTLSAGYAKGSGPQALRGGEWMVSLKILGN